MPTFVLVWTDEKSMIISLASDVNWPVVVMAFFNGRSMTNSSVNWKLSVFGKKDIASDNIREKFCSIWFIILLICSLLPEGNRKQI